MIASIQYFRIIAALSVAVYHVCHYIYIVHLGYPIAMDHWFFFGKVGVDVFFIISGFVMYITEHENQQGSIANSIYFLAKRIIRIIPIYWLVTILWSFYGEPEISVKKIFASLFFIPLTDIQTPPPLFFTPVVDVGWTLNYEMWFYIIFSISLLFGKLRMAAIAVLGILPMVISWHYTGAMNLDPHKAVRHDIVWFSLISNPILLEFLSGIILGAIYKAPQSSIIKKISVINIPLALLLFFYIYCLSYIMTWGHSWLTPMSLLTTIQKRASHGMFNGGLFCFAFLSLVVIYEKYHGMSISPFFIKLSDASYMIYLINVPILKATIEHMHFTHQSALIYLFIFFLIIVTSSIFLHIAIEAPITRWLRRIVLPRVLLHRREHTRNLNAT